MTIIRSIRANVYILILCNEVASQAKSIYLYKSIRSKVLKCNANIFFNKDFVA